MSLLAGQAFFELHHDLGHLWISVWKSVKAQHWIFFVLFQRVLQLQSHVGVLVQRSDLIHL